jgi:hypothetical protein
LYRVHNGVGKVKVFKGKMLSLGQVCYKKMDGPLSVDLFHLKKKKNLLIPSLGKKP